VGRAIGMDHRIGPEFLRASVGFGGSCFRKDILNLVYICEHYGLYDVARYWEAVVQINEYQERRFVDRMLQAMFGTVAGKRIALLGFAFKADTGDTRDSPAIYVARTLLAEQAQVVITDPRALANARIDLRDCGDRVSFTEDPVRAAAGAHAIALLTDWDVYRTLDYAAIFGAMEKPAFVFDGRNALDHRRLFDLGFNVYPLGKPALRHE
jgi:UDPglucose 6-dehydrogenase